MNKIISILAILMLTGCAGLPVTKKFPSAPATLLVDCAKLSTVPADTTSLSVVTRTVVKNYTVANECASKHQAWIEWYNTQKKPDKIRGYK